MIQEKSKELLRQAELRIEGILEFSSKLDDKILNLLYVNCILFLSLLLSLSIQPQIYPNKALSLSLIFALILIIASKIVLLLAIKPAGYKGVGLPLSEFEDDKSLDEIIQKAKDRYDTRFKINRVLNDKKANYLNSCITLLTFIPTLTLLFYLSLQFFS